MHMKPLQLRQKSKWKINASEPSQQPNLDTLMQRKIEVFMLYNTCLLLAPCMDQNWTLKPWSESHVVAYEKTFRLYWPSLWIANLLAHNGNQYGRNFQTVLAHWIVVRADFLYFLYLLLLKFWKILVLAQPPLSEIASVPRNCMASSLPVSPAWLLPHSQGKLSVLGFILACFLICELVCILEKVLML